MIKEKLEDISIQYYYSKDFRWIDPMLSEQFQGHPRPGQVYRAIVNDSTKNIKVIVSENTAVVINDFLHGIHYEGYLTPLTLENILELNLEEKELDRIIKWQERDHADLKRLYNPQQTTGEHVVLQTLANAMNQQAGEEREDITRATNLLAALRITDSVGFELILELIDALGHESMSDEPSRALATDPRFSTGINVSRAMNSLCRYIGDDKRTNYDREDLIEAFLGIVNELKAIEAE
jgi:hypothetical protein